MSRILVTGSSDGIGRMTARLLVERGHRVVLHARNTARARVAADAVPGAEAVLTGDLSSLAETRALAAAANASGRFDAVIHNAAVGFRERRRIETVDGLAHVFAVNTLGPYVLTALMTRPRAAGLRQLRAASPRRHHPRGPELGAATLARQPGLFGYQAARRAARLRGGAALAGGAVQRNRAGLGADQDGRRARDRRPRPGASDPGLARDVRRCRRVRHRRLLLPRAPAQAARRHRRPRLAGDAACRMRAAVRCRLALTATPVRHSARRAALYKA